MKFLLDIIYKIMATLLIPDKLLINLKILSRIEKNGRISRSYSGVISIDSDVFYQSLKRYISHDSIIDEANIKITSLLENRNLRTGVNAEYIRICEILNLLYNELPGVITGLDNLKFTYKSDVYTESQIEIILINVRSISKNLGLKLPILITKIPDGKLPDSFLIFEANNKRSGKLSDTESDDSDSNIPKHMRSAMF
jgi:hypothetical protein